MPIQRVGVFTLDTSNQRFYTLCGKVHVKLALTVIVFFLICLELSEWIAYVTVDNIGERTDWSEALMSLLQLLMVACMAFGLVTERAFLLVPFILFMFLSVTSFLLWVCQCMFWIFTPYSQTVEDLFGFVDDSTLYYREKCILMLLAVLVTFTTMFSWWLQIGMICYQYFESRHNEIKTKMAALSAGRPPMVAGTSVNSNQEVPKPNNNGLSFPNQTFSIADDEDEDDNVFEKNNRNGPPAVNNNTDARQETPNMSFSNQNFSSLDEKEEEDEDDNVFEKAKGPNMAMKLQKKSSDCGEDCSSPTSHFPI